MSSQFLKIRMKELFDWQERHNRRLRSKKRSLLFSQIQFEPTGLEKVRSSESDSMSSEILFLIGREFHEEAEEEPTARNIEGCATGRAVIDNRSPRDVKGLCSSAHLKIVMGDVYRICDR
jgi:hypothetical protein